MFRWKEAREYRASTVVLVIANLIPLIGVFAWGWSAFNVVALYWLENVIIGGINILKMLTCNPDPTQIKMLATVRQRIEQSRSQQRSQAISSGGNDGKQSTLQMEQGLQQLEQMTGKLGCANHGVKLFMVPFFTVHYGIFCLVHGIFVVALLGGDRAFSGASSKPMAGSPFDGLGELFGQVLSGAGWWFALGLLGSHLFSFFVNYLGKGEYRRTVVPALMVAPYPRIVVLHIAILLGAFAISALGDSVFMVLLLVIGKIIVDLGLHLRSHFKLDPELTLATSISKVS